MDPIQVAIQSTSDTQGVDEFGSSLLRIGEITAGLELAKIVQGFEDIATAGFQAAASAENMRVSFDSAFGSGSSGMLSNLDALSYHTTLSNTQLDEMALKLQTAGLASDQIVSSLQDIVNVSSGTGTSLQDISQKADVMAQALARAQQYGSISSLFLRPIISQNIPLIDALVKVINDSGGAYDKSAASIAKQAKQVEAAKAKHDQLLHSIADEEKQLNILNETNIKVGFGHANSAKTLDSHAKAIEDAKYKLAQFNTELDKTNKIIGQPSATPITKLDLLQNARSITISAEQLQAAYKLMGEGKYANDAQKQAETLNGTLKNLTATFLDMAKGIIGVNSDNSIVKGGLFDTLKNYATEFFNYLQAHKSQIETWFKTEIKVFIDYVVAHKSDIQTFFGTMVSDLEKLGKWFTDNKDTLTGILAFIGGTVQFAGTAANYAQGVTGATSKFLGGVSSPDAQGGIPHLNYAALNNIAGTSPVGQAMGYNANNSRNVSVTMNNTVNKTADWNSLVNYIGWVVNHR